MEPRLKSSTRFTSLPSELCRQVEGIFSENFSKHLKGKTKFIVEGRIYKQELLLRVGFIAAGTIRQSNFEVSLEYNPIKENALKQIHLAIDCAASMMEEYFTTEAEVPWDEFPKIWEPFDIQGKKVYLQVSAVNSELEAEANRLLGEETSEMVQGEDIEGDKKAVISMLGLDGDDTEPDTQDDSDDEPTKH